MGMTTLPYVSGKDAGDTGKARILQPKQRVRPLIKSGGLILRSI
jgi:hypothetical protein